MCRIVSIKKYFDTIIFYAWQQSEHVLHRWCRKQSKPQVIAAAQNHSTILAERDLRVCAGAARSTLIQVEATMKTNRENQMQ